MNRVKIAMVRVHLTKQNDTDYYKIKNKIKR